MSSNDLAISVTGVSKVYHLYEKPQDRLKQILWKSAANPSDEFWALRDINFDVKKGETVGIVGRNGSGKSTLLQIICGTLTPSHGHVERQGRLSALLELGSGFNPEFTGRENVYLSASILGLSKEEIDNRFDKIAGFADIGQFIDSPVKHYSSGMFARLAFSVSVHVEPEILIVDEILAVGDAAFQRRCLSKFYEIRDRGCTILFVSHDQYQVKSVCERALYLKEGQQIMFGPAPRVIDQYMIEMEAQVAQNTPAAFTATQATATVESHVDSDPAESGASKPKSVAPKTTLSSSESADQLFRITDVRLTDTEGTPLDTVTTGQSVRVNFDFIALVDAPPEEISFVFNLYRHDELYLCGATTLMDKIPAYRSSSAGTVSIDFADLPLLSGQYKWRVAINDNVGFITYAEAKNACSFRVEDNFKAVGMLSLPRQWNFQATELNSI
ncbi:ABC transporter ATP-binding protein [Pseudomonas kielensis]|uniref:ABC transporter ATP-binding protein n=1 Tax=Pseudomonas TaxID=286 RepID=UPI00131F68D1|nr:MULTISPECIES: ABC transporter ATP-binding protein [Pseudomonas]MDX9664598.1 ABC transporter ATP-binding protein [Pseudomonas sp. P5_152]NBB35324.1 ATP-binding cassette domain-containing protein [Pseudomonas sp. BC115LW]QHD02566.1 ABC transporter [Pseudomonas sp. S04]QHF35049.1 ABC transporter [Pseudomonas sp. S19]WKL51372.1 ABC transporter ATP-binding protein [Pseudomonas kielensis]